MSDEQTTDQSWPTIGYRSERDDEEIWRARWEGVARGIIDKAIRDSGTAARFLDWRFRETLTREIGHALGMTTKGIAR